MFRLNICGTDNSWSITCDAEEQPNSLKELLDDHHIPLPGKCGGVGKCGLCLVQMISGKASALTLRDQETLTADEVAQGYRLACQIQPHSEMDIVICSEPGEG